MFYKFGAWLLCFNCVFAVTCFIVVCVSSLKCRGLVIDCAISWPRGYKTFSMLNSTIFGIFTFISMINTKSERLKAMSFLVVSILVLWALGISNELSVKNAL